LPGALAAKGSAPVSLKTPQPEVVTNLSALSPSSGPDVPGLQGNSVKPRPKAESAVPNKPASSPTPADANLRRLFLDHPESAQYVGAYSPPGEELLLNAKAKRFGAFSDALAHQVLSAARELEKGPLSYRQLPNDLDPVVLTAIMAPNGRLTEIIIEQNSGLAAVDHLFVNACKRGLWSNTPPAAALSKEGVYRLRIKAWIKNYQADYHGAWSFDTRVGIALL
jgi:hypothetical protein